MYLGLSADRRLCAEGDGKRNADYFEKAFHGAKLQNNA
jgi:hypothetical protein